jgi:adenylate cyclase
MEEVEIEFKNMLTEEEFNRIKDGLSLAESDFFQQINDYLDTEDFSLKKKGCALRIRRKQGIYELTLKQPHTTGLLETSDQLSRDEADRILGSGAFPEGSVKARLIEIGISPEKLRHVGTLSTNRAERQWEEGLICLDKSSYFQKIDYELEYEVTDEKRGRERFCELLNRFGIPLRPAENKIFRLYREKTRIARMERG